MEPEKLRNTVDYDAPKVQTNADPDHPKDCHAPCCDLGGYAV